MDLLWANLNVIPQRTAAPSSMVPFYAAITKEAR